jgi:hypothetical protein
MIPVSSFELKFHKKKRKVAQQIKEREGVFILRLRYVPCFAVLSICVLYTFLCVFG